MKKSAGKMPSVLNVSQEVVKMRSEVKRVKALVIRKLTRQMAMLKKRKGKDEELQRNQRRAARLLEELHEIKVLNPDTITKAALQQDIVFDKVCQKPDASISERAIARIATHPQFSQKVHSIKERVKAFKGDRIITPCEREKPSKADRSSVNCELKGNTVDAGHELKPRKADEVEISCEIRQEKVVVHVDSQDMMAGGELMENHVPDREEQNKRLEEEREETGSKELKLENTENMEESKHQIEPLEEKQESVESPGSDKEEGEQQKNQGNEPIDNKDAEEMEYAEQTDRVEKKLAEQRDGGEELTEQRDGGEELAEQRDGGEELAEQRDEKKKTTDEKNPEDEDGVEGAGKQQFETETAIAPVHQIEADKSTPKLNLTQLLTEADPLVLTRMRKEVKKIRVLIISKLTRQIDALKKKKVEANQMDEVQKKTSALQKDIQALRCLRLDLATVAALQEGMDLASVNADPQVTAQQRAIARIATHPHFIKKLETVRDAIKEEKTKAAEAHEKMTRAALGHDDEEEEDEQDSSDEEGREEVEGESEEEDCEEEEEDETEEEGEEESDDEEVEEEEETDDKREEEEEDDASSSGKPLLVRKPQASEKTEDEGLVKSLPLARNKPDVIKKPVREIEVVMSEPVKVKLSASENNPKSVVATSLSSKKNTAAPPSQTISRSAQQVKKGVVVTPSKSMPKHVEKRTVNQSGGGDSESDLESSSDEEEKPYFDDSTEERFLKQSSQSEESEEDDFFIGKVSKFKKKRKNPQVGQLTANKNKKAGTGENSELPPKQDGTLRGTDIKLTKAESVFCSTLSNTNSSGGRGTGVPRHRPRPGSGGRPPTGKRWGGDPKTPGEKKPNQDSTPHWKSGGQRASYQNQNPPPGDASREGGGWEKRTQGRGQGRHQVDRRPLPNQVTRPPPVRTFNNVQRTSSEAIHPSWEASRKRKEQISQITAFQGKKIKFDDDD